MHKRFFLPALLLLALPLGMRAQGNPKTAAKKAQALDIKVHVKGLSSGQCLLYHHYGDKQAIQDTAKVDAKGNFEFKDTAKAGGIYLVVLPSKKYFEIIITDQQQFSLETDTADLVRNMKVTGSKENQYFYEYLVYLSDRQKEMESWQSLSKKTKNKDSLALIQKKEIVIDSMVRQYKRSYYKTRHPETFMAEVLAAMDEPDQIPYSKCPKKPDGTIDSTYNFRNFKAHYWDGMNFSDDRLVRTPVYANKMKFYMDVLTPQTPDSINAALDWLLAKASASKELFQYTMQTNITKYETSKTMGFDAVFVHIAKTYYETNRAWWISEEQKTKIVNRANQLNYALIGKTAVNLSLQDTSDHTRQLQDVKAKYTVLIFWDPTCSHCKVEVPLLKTYYDSLKKAGVSVEVYAIVSEPDTHGWKEYIKEHQLSWVNVAAKDAQVLATAKYYYDVYMTPTILVMDENKKIFGKRLDVTNLKTVLNRQIAADQKKAAKKAE